MQRIRWKLIGFFLLLLPLLWGQGTVSATLTQLGTSGTIWVIQFNWTGDAGGNVPVTAAGNLAAIQGYELTQVECTPGNVQPSATYGVAVLDASGVDVLAGAANNVAGGQAQTFSAATATPPLQGTLRLQITKNTVAGAQGAVYVFLQKPGTLSSKKIRSMGVGGGPVNVNADWLTLANSPFADARRYNFPPQAPGGTLTAGTNTVTLAPCPIGVNGTDTAHYLYISGGTGTAEAVLITGGTCTSGLTPGTVTFTAANAHSGAWTVSSATGGIDEAACTFGGSGGTISVVVNLTLYANASGCGKAPVIVQRAAGAIIGGAFTVLGQTMSSYSMVRAAQTVPNWTTLHTLYNGTQFDIGGYPDSLQFLFNNGPVAQALVGSVNSSGVSGNANQASGVSGYGMTGSQYSNVVAVYGGAYCAGAFTQCWGANFTVGSTGTPPSGGSNLVGVEVDSNHSNTGGAAAAIIKGVTSVANLVTQPSGYAYAFQAIKTGSSFAWNTAYNSDNGAAVNGLVLGQALASGATQSQNILLVSNTGAAQSVSQIFEDQNGNLILRPASAKGVVLDPGQTGNGTVIATGQGGLQIAKNAFSALPACTAALEGLMWPVTDSTTATWGATITGLGTNHVLAYCDGSSWTVAAK